MRQYQCRDFTIIVKCFFMFVGSGSFSVHGEHNWTTLKAEAVQGFMV
jgi:hypothetical protein